MLSAHWYRGFVLGLTKMRDFKSVFNRSHVTLFLLITKLLQLHVRFVLFFYWLDHDVLEFSAKDVTNII